MRAPRISADEQFRLIMECRASGLTDYEWCLQNDIKPGAFYNWVKRLRQKGCIDIPDTMRKPDPDKQEIVKIQLTPHGKKETVLSPAMNRDAQSLHNEVMELSIADTVLRIPNGTDPVLLRQTLQILKELCFLQDLFE